MSKKKYTVTVTREYEIEVDHDNEIVKEYEDLQALMEDIVVYNFEILPVMDEGVRLIDDWITQRDIEELK